MRKEWTYREELRIEQEADFHTAFHVEEKEGIKNLVLNPKYWNKTRLEKNNIAEHPGEVYLCEYEVDSNTIVILPLADDENEVTVTGTLTEMFCGWDFGGEQTFEPCEPARVMRWVCHVSFDKDGNVVSYYWSRRES